LLDVAVRLAAEEEAAEEARLAALAAGSDEDEGDEEDEDERKETEETSEGKEGGWAWGDCSGVDRGGAVPKGLERGGGGEARAQVASLVVLHNAYNTHLRPLLLLLLLLL
jgi:hypothetical protein